MLLNDDKSNFVMFICNNISITCTCTTTGDTDTHVLVAYIACTLNIEEGRGSLEGFPKLILHYPSGW